MQGIINFVCPHCGAVISRNFWGRMFACHREKTMWRSIHTQLWLECPGCNKRSWMPQEQILKERQGIRDGI